MTDLDFVHRFVPALDRDSSVTLLLLHGTGGNEEDMIPLGRELLPGAALLSPRGRVLESGMPRFFRRFAEGVFDVEDLKRRAAELSAFIDAARDRYGFADQKLVAVGYSNGANIAAGLILLRPQQLSAALLFRAMVPFKSDRVPNLAGMPIHLSAGRRDFIASPENTSELAGIFKAAGADVSIHWHNGGHELGPDDVESAKIWLADYAASR